MFQIKICGITSVDDASRAADAGADAIGLNFYSQSPRFVSIEIAHKIVDVLGSRVQMVGVFVNAPLDTIVDLADRLPLDFIQLHGDEPAESVLALSPRPVIRAFRLREGEERSLIAYVMRCEGLGAPLSAILIDAYQAGTYGGTGKMANLEQIRQIGREVHPTKVILAGGLDEQNVQQAILTARCAAADVASGVEASPGKKDERKMRAFVRAARRGLAEIESG